MIREIIYNVTHLHLSKLPKIFHGIQNNIVAVKE
jgi:hypothetical protein